MGEIVHLRREYELTNEEFMELVLAMYGSMPTEEKDISIPLENSYERCNEVWKKIAAARGLNWKSIMPSKRGPEYFMVLVSNE